MNKICFCVSAKLKLELDIDVVDGQITRSTLTQGTDAGIICRVQGEISDDLKADLQQWLSDYAEGKQPEVVLPLSLKAMPPFISRVLWALHEVPFGQTLSYGEMAAQLHKPKAARAVGQACGRNPLILFIPCHRVLAANKKLGGFSADPSLKPLLLAHEAVQLA